MKGYCVDVDSSFGDSVVAFVDHLLAVKLTGRTIRELTGMIAKGFKDYVTLGELVSGMLETDPQRIKFITFDKSLTEPGHSDDPASAVSRAKKLIMKSLPPKHKPHGLSEETLHTLVDAYEFGARCAAAVLIHDAAATDPTCQVPIGECLLLQWMVEVNLVLSQQVPFSVGAANVVPYPEVQT